MEMRIFRVVSAIVLITVFSIFSGLPESVSAVLYGKAEESCCDECNKDETQIPTHCSTSDCPLFLCLSTNIVSPFMLSVSSESVYFLQFVKELHPKSPIRAIFHPPKVL